MAGRYVPPHLRNRSENEKPPADAPPPTKPAREWVTKEEINNYFWPGLENENRENENLENENQSGDTTTSQHRERTSDGKTMHDSAATPGELACVLLFSDHGKPANPRWDADGTIFAKSNLDLLPGYTEGLKPRSDSNPPESHASTESDATPNGSSPNKAESVGHPIAVFKQTSASRRPPGFVFEGWYKIERTAFLAPRSQELEKMLEQKWSWTNNKGNVFQTNRKGANWERSFNMRWAVVKFVKDAKADEERGVPKIERLPDAKEEFPKKGVNEMLADMRLKDTAGDDAKGSAATPGDNPAQASGGTAGP